MSTGGVLNNKDHRRQNKILIISGILLCLTLIIEISYAWWTSIAEQTTSNRVASNCLKLELTDDTSSISIDNGYPITDVEARTLTPYTFTVRNTCNTSVLYNVELDIIETKNASGEDIRLRSEYIAVSFDGATKQMLSTLENITPSYTKSDYKAVEARKLTSGKLNANEIKTYTIKLWIDEHVTVEDDAMNKEFISKIVVNARLDQIVEYQEKILNGSYPVLKGDLVPVVISDTGVVTKANINEEWYSYENKKWANAVILLDKSVMYTEGQTIPEENIESYFVWIPKYKYKLWNIGDTPGEPREIEIVFTTVDTQDATSGECTTPMLSEATGNCKVGDYMTHPSFISMGTNGLWVGKFETGYKGATVTTEAEVNSSESGKIQIKPNVYSWRKIQVANAYLASYNYNRDLDSHMMKNTEWGSVAYLSHSEYGRCVNGLCTEIAINRNSSYITGMAITTAYSSVSTSASTTGNYSGIYDINGGAWEYTMGVMKDLDGIPISASSGFTTIPDARYMDVYNYNESPSNYEGRILGDATAETKDWYRDYASFIDSKSPWFRRSGAWYEGYYAGAFNFYGFNGTGDILGFRVVLNTVALSA